MAMISNLEFHCIYYTNQLTFYLTSNNTHNIKNIFMNILKQFFCRYCCVLSLFINFLIFLTSFFSIRTLLKFISFLYKLNIDLKNYYTRVLTNIVLCFGSILTVCSAEVETIVKVVGEVVPNLEDVSDVFCHFFKQFILMFWIIK